MKNLIKVLLVLAFSTSAFASPSAAFPDPKDVTTETLEKMTPEMQKSWVMSLNKDQYNMLNSQVQEWVQNNSDDALKMKLGIMSN